MSAPAPSSRPIRAGRWALSSLGGGEYEVVFDWGFATFVGQKVRAQVVAVASASGSRPRLDGRAGAGDHVRLTSARNNSARFERRCFGRLVLLEL